MDCDNVACISRSRWRFFDDQDVSLEYGSADYLCLLAQFLIGKVVVYGSHFAGGEAQRHLSFWQQDVDLVWQRPGQLKSDRRGTLLRGF